MNKEIEKEIVKLIKMCEEDGNEGFSTSVKLHGEELYVSFGWRVLQPKCKLCKRRLEE